MSDRRGHGPRLLLSLVLVAGCSSTSSQPDGSTSTDKLGPSSERGVTGDGGSTTSCQARTTHGLVAGIQQKSSCAYLGIPYAKPPVGPLRWRKPEPPEPWTTSLGATKHGLACPQWPNSIGVFPWGPIGEDCLTLNVWTPTPRPSSPAPVMVWINKTSGFFEGSSHSGWTEGTNLAERTGTVLVSFDFRLAALGFLAHPALGSDSGNYGFWDQIAALQWVQANIAAFGGDPKNVTINGGGSQGAQSVCVHLVSPASKGLFHRAIMESGNCPGLPPAAGYSQVLTRSQAEAQADLLVQKIGCSGAGDIAACLRAKKDTEVRDALLPRSPLGGGDAIWGPIIDGQILADQPEKLLAAGPVNKVPLLIGTNKDEGAGLGSAIAFATEQQFVDGMKTGPLAAVAGQVLAQYPLSEFEPPPGSTYSAAAYAAKAIFTDLIWACPSRRAARAMAAAGLATYLYQFTLPISYGLSTPDPYSGTGGSSMKVLVFHTPQPTAMPGWEPWVFNADEEALSWKIMDYWARFARSGDPNGAGAISWPGYDQATDRHLELGKEVKAGSNLKQARCDFWDSITP